MHFSILLAALFPALAVAAAHIRMFQASHRISSLATLTSTQLSSLAPFTQFARAAYCSPSVIREWACEACRAIPDFKLSFVGGDGVDTQYYYVGYWPFSNSIVVAHQGTQFSHLFADLTDPDIVMENLNPILFPGVDSAVQVHNGFANDHAKTALIILDQVKLLISRFRAASVTLVGHSLGGALAELDCVFMALNLPSHIAIRGVTYGTPRVGNAAWAALFDATISDFRRINNKKDLIPILPPRWMGFSHVMGEIHIIRPDYAVECPEDDDATHSQCTVTTVPNLMAGDFADHFGPYQGIYITNDCT